MSDAAVILGDPGTRTNYRTAAMGIAFRTSMIVPAPNGARCLEVPADAPLWQEFRSAVSTERLNRPSANRKRPRSISRVFQSIRGAIRGSVGAAESSTRHRHACGPVGGPPTSPLVRRSSGNPRGSVTYSMPPICLRPGVCVWPYSQALSFPWRSCPGAPGRNLTA